MAIALLASVGVVLSSPAAWADSASDNRATFVSGNATTCAGVGFASDTQLGSNSDQNASDQNVSGVVKTNAGTVDTGQGEEVDLTLSSSFAVVDALVVKGGSGYNLYTTPAYLPPSLGPDQHYIAPFTGGSVIPTISHWFVCYHVVPHPALSITKTADAETVVAGSSIGFTVTVTSTGNVTATSVTLSDPLPAGPDNSGVNWLIVPDYQGPGTCSITGSAPQTLGCAFGDMAPGASASVHVTSATTPASVGTYDNTATAAATNVDQPVQASASTNVIDPEISITKTADAPSVSAGSLIGFTVTVTSSGATTATGVTLTDPLPPGSDVSWLVKPAYQGPGTCAVNGNAPSQELDCSFGDMAAGTSASVHISSTTTVASIGTYKNTATASATNVANPVQATATTNVYGPDLTITKTADAPSVVGGSPIGFTVTVSNVSSPTTGTATAVTLSDPLPAGPAGSGINWSIFPAYSGQGSCSITGTAPSQTLGCSFGDMAPGDSASVHIRSATTFASVGTYPNTATANASNIGTPVQASATTKVLPVTLKVFFGYADGLRTTANSTPGTPWEGSPDTNFVGCPNDNCPNGKGQYDSGAILIENNSAKSLTFNSGFVVIGHCTFTPWGTGVTIPGESGKTLGALALTQTLKGLKPQGNQAGCPLVTGPTINDNFDTSETDPAACALQTKDDGLIPKVTVTINNQTFTLNDTKQVLNTGGRDRGCGGKTSETTPWGLVLTTTLAPSHAASSR
jgi:uncharacterized repeat protein (TIGR01451 family)